MAQPQIAGRRSINVELEPGTYYWCSCGKSKTQPFCDGAHAGSDFTPVALEITEKKRVAFCACKHSQKGACCDGSHARLP